MDFVEKYLERGEEEDEFATDIDNSSADEQQDYDTGESELLSNLLQVTVKQIDIVEFDSSQKGVHVRLLNNRPDVLPSDIVAVINGIFF